MIQAPGGADEDVRGGFSHGGWAAPYSSDGMNRLLGGESDGTPEAMLFGRRTYEQFFDFWPKQAANPYTEHMNRVRKYVVSHTLSEPLPWQNSTLISGDAAKEIAVRKQDTNLILMGSGALIRSLLPSGVIDEYKLLIHPIVLGTGQRLFDAGTEATLHLERAEATTTGIVIHHYRSTPAS